MYGMFKPEMQMLAIMYKANTLAFTTLTIQLQAIFHTTNYQIKCSKNLNILCYTIPLGTSNEGGGLLEKIVTIFTVN